MKTYKHILILLSLMLISFNIKANDDEPINKRKLEHRFIAGYNFGATMPVPLPREVRSINGYWPQFTPQLGYLFTYNYSPKWGIQAGILLEFKGMGVRDKVKYMYTNVVMDGAEMKGYFVGKNETKVRTSYFTVPIKLSYQVSEKWKVNLGGYISYKASSEFSGTVWDGYIRQIVGDEPITESEKIDIPDKDLAVFDFGKEMRKYDVGITVGFEHQFNYRFGMYGDLNWGIPSVFPSSFKGIDMKMHNIYLALGMSYRLK